MGRLSDSITILRSLPDPPPDADAALIDAVSLIIAPLLMSAAENGSLAAGTAQEGASSESAARVTTGLLSRELITEAQSEVLMARMTEHLAGRRGMAGRMHDASESKGAAIVCGVIGAVMATTSRGASTLVETTDPFDKVEYRGSVQEDAGGKPSSYTVAASNAAGSAMKFAGVTTVSGTGDAISGSATYGVPGGSQTLSYSSEDEASSAKVTFTEGDEGAGGEAGDEGTVDSGVDAGGDITSGVSVVVDGDQTSFTSTVTDDDGNISIVSVTQFSGTGAWTLTITTVDSTGAGTSTIIMGDGEGNVTEVTISNVEELGEVDSGETGDTGTTGFDDNEVDTTLTEDDNTTVTEVSSSTVGDDVGDE